MSLVPTIYTSDDPGSPVLTGQIGSLTALLDAVLVDGYGSGPDAKASAGWTRAYTAANKRVYRNNPVSGSGYSLWVDDTGTVGNARHGWFRGFEEMSDVDSGVNPVPLVAQRTNGCLVAKSTTLSSVARPWIILATERSFYLLVDMGTNGWFHPMFAGDPVSYVPGDRHAFTVTNPNPTDVSYVGGQFVNDSVLCVASSTFSAPAATASCYIGRSHNGVAGSVSANSYAFIQGTTVGGAGGAAYPSAVNGGLFTTRLILMHAARLPRGHFPGLVVANENIPFASFDSMDLMQDVAGFPHPLLMVKCNKRYPQSITNNNNACLLFEVGTEWY